MSTPLIDITEPHKQRLDVLRMLRVGVDARLDLLKHDPDKGYAVLAAYTDGWALTQGDWRTPDQIEVADVDGDRAADLRKARAFGIEALGIVYRLADSGSHAPATTYRRVWLYYVEATSEAWPQT